MCVCVFVVPLGWFAQIGAKPILERWRKWSAPSRDGWFCSKER